MSETQSLQGRVKWFSSRLGIGFLVGPPPDERDVFVHFSFVLMEGYKTLAKNQLVSYDLVQTERGLQAHNVRPL